MTRQDRQAAVVEAVNKQLLIGGSWTAASGRRTFDVTDPSNGKVLCSVADAGADDGFAAVAAADAAQRDWAATAPRERGEVMRRAYELLTERAEDLGLLMTLEMGKPLAEACGEVRYAAEFFRWFAEEAVRIDGGYATAPSGTNRFLVMRQAVGPCLLITPWNFPMAMGTRKMGPAIAAGCSMIVKPAEQTPLSMLALADIMREAGLPEGVLSVLTTSDPGAVCEPILRDGRVRKVSFTGSTPVGKVLLEQSADKVLRTSMELGGNAPFVVFDDADIDAAVDGAMVAKTRNIGQACTAANRFYVQRGVAERFAAKLAERMGAMKVGPGVEEGVTVGPLIDADAVDKVTTLVSDAVGRGAKVLTGGSEHDGPGHFYRPTVLTEVPGGARMAGEEIFGPIAPISVFDTEQEAIEAANDTDFGLVSYVYTADLNRSLRVCERLDTGMVGLNTGLVSNPAAPFGGVKQSGLGREGGTVGIEEFLETKYVAIAEP